MKGKLSCHRHRLDLGVVILLCILWGNAKGAGVEPGAFWPVGGRDRHRSQYVPLRRTPEPLRQRFSIDISYTLISNSFKWTGRGSPVIDADGYIYMYSSSEVLSCVDPSGRVRWFADLTKGSTSKQPPTTDNDPLLSPVLVPNGDIIVVYGKYLIAYNKDGGRIWQTNLHSDLSYSTLGVSSTGVLYVFAASQLYAIDPLADGQVLFSRDHLNTTLAFPATAVAAVNVGAVSSQMGSSVTLATVQPIDDTKVAVMYGHRLMVMSASSGSLLWTRADKVINEDYATVLHGRVYVSDDIGLYSLSPSTGEVLGSWALPEVTSAFVNTTEYILPTSQKLATSPDGGLYGEYYTWENSGWFRALASANGTSVILDQMAPMLTPSLENIFSMSPPVVDLDNHLWAVASSRVSTSSGGVTFNCSLLRFDTYGNVSEALSLGRCQKGVTTPVFGPDGSVYVRLDDRLVAVAAMEGCGHAQGLDSVEASAMVGTGSCITCKPGTAPYFGVCRACDVGRYSLGNGQLRCSPCDPGFFNPQKGMSSCRRCTGIAFAEAGSAKCDRICMCQKPWLVGLILLSLLTLVGIGVWIARRVDGVLMSLLLPTADLMSDVLYLLTTVFYHPLLFTLCLGLLLLPLPIFTYRVLVIEKLVPRNIVSPVEWPFRLWRLQLSTIPQPQLPRRLQFRRVDNIIKLAIMLWFTTIATLLRATFLWVLLWVQLTIFLPPFLLVNWHWVIVQTLFCVPCLIVGGVLYATKVYAVLPIKNRWTRVWTGKKAVSVSEGELPLQLQEFNRMLVSEVFTESLPQLCIQGLNSWFTSRLGTAARVSVSLSMLAIVNTLYKYIYYTLYRKVPLKDVPISFFATEASGRMMATLGRTLRRTMKRTGGSVVPWAGATGGRRTTRDGKAVLVEQGSVDVLTGLRVFVVNLDTVPPCTLTLTPQGDGVTLTMVMRDGKAGEETGAGVKGGERLMLQGTLHCAPATTEGGMAQATLRLCGGEADFCVMDERGGGAGMQGPTDINAEAPQAEPRGAKPGNYAQGSLGGGSQGAMALGAGAGREGTSPRQAPPPLATSPSGSGYLSHQAVSSPERQQAGGNSRDPASEDNGRSVRNPLSRAT